jgi:hypothetical protein
LELRRFTPGRQRSPDDRGEIATGRAAGEERRGGLPEERRRGRASAADGSGGRGSNRRRSARTQRSVERLTWRNGYRDRTLETRLGPLQLRIPKPRQGSYFPPFLEARKTSEKALVAVIQEAWVGGVSTRRVDDLVQALGLSGISKSTVSKLCKACEARSAS